MKRLNFSTENERMEYFMYIALKEAGKSLKYEDVPVGAIIVKNNEVIAKAHNQVEEKGNSIHHAEMIAINKAVRKLGYKHLLDCELFVTLEPCPMCAGAVVLSRIPKLYIGTNDPKAGACGSVLNITENNLLNHKCLVNRDILQDKCSGIIKDFFKKIRENKRIAKK